VRISPRLVSGAYRYARRTLERNPDRFFSDFEKDCSDSDRVLMGDPAFRAAIRGSILEALRTGVGGAVDDWVVLERRPWGFAPEDVHVPTLLVFGEADRIVLPASGRELARRISHARVVEVPGEGHMLILARLGEILDDLVAESGAAPHDASVAQQPPG
jgi:pimeloyl-ACP methyl ester carboxylesterase